MFNWIGIAVKSLLPTLVPYILIIITSFTGFMLYKSNENYKTTVLKQEEIIADLRKVNVEVQGLYSEVTKRLNKVDSDALESISKIESLSNSLGVGDNILEEKLPSEIIKILNE